MSRFSSQTFLLVAFAVFSCVRAGTLCIEKPHCEGANEEYTSCGNICENDCKNYGQAPVLDPFDYPDICEEQCACQIGYIRNKHGACVVDRPGFCKKKLPCKGPNEVYRRCGDYCQNFCNGPHCINPLRAFTPSGCYCRIGYVRDIKTEKCIRQDSPACLHQQFFQKLIEV